MSMSEGTRKLKMQVNPYLPNCQKCPWIIWCQKLNFRIQDKKSGQIMRACPIWAMVFELLKDKGIMKQPLPAAPPMSDAEAKIIMDQLRKQRLLGLGMTAA